MRKSDWTRPQQRGKFVSIFIFFFLLTIIFSVLFKTSFGDKTTGFLENIFRPFQKNTYTFYTKVQGSDEESELKRLQKENLELRAKIQERNELEKEISALHDQFNTPAISSRSLTPAKIVGIKSFVPGFSIPSQIVLDIGSDNGVIVGQVVISKNILIGKIVKVSPHTSLVDLTTKKGFSLTAQTEKTEVLGIIKGQDGGQMLLENVLLSDKLQEGELVMSKGSINEEGVGSPPGLLLGKILAINKKASSLFQSAEVAPVIDVTQLDTVFILNRQ